MPVAAATHDRPDRQLTIQQVSALLAVPISTLRTWEYRYAVPGIVRTRGGHRRYPARAIDELRIIRDEIARGRRAGDAATTARLLVESAEPGRELVNRFLDAAHAMDQGGIRSCLDDAARQLGLGATVDLVLVPAMRRIGHWWEIGTCDVGHEHLATEAARTWLARLVAFAPEPRPGGGVLLACGPRDLHSLGLEAFGMLLASNGRACRVLGARTPVPALTSAVHTLEPAAVVVVSHLASARRPAVDALAAVAALGTPVFYAGNAFLTRPARRRVPGCYLGESHREAAGILEEFLVRRSVDEPG
ncbi:B12-binding domain-containing protein [Pseudonocardia kujensis]|uniref:MerR family transcriptional regulator n=1 Tax=Pseudonocardia kujensis TaxID=1128675 RepID=UPI001E56A7C1|nr:B12-binding domain-containing protein [Pseudonocardia kujensis]MCE0763730.1 B12-binding domain-containing protein [Pseudonocardia kujensis]